MPKSPIRVWGEVISLACCQVGICPKYLSRPGREEAGEVCSSPKRAGMFRFQPGLGRGQYTWGEESASCPHAAPGSVCQTPPVLCREGSCSYPDLNPCSEGDILFLLTSEEDSLH